ncbi:MAG: dihydroxyacetone kinase subunit DhaL [Opitutaceae bacterium]
MASTFTNAAGARIVPDLIKAIQSQKQYLSDIDGAIGDGDHGINMNKGFTLAGEQLVAAPGDLTHALNTLSRVLMLKIGGSMGPLYGMFFKAMATATNGVDPIDAAVVARMLWASRESIEKISPARPGDKTLIDTLVPAVDAYQAALDQGRSFPDCLDSMSEAAERGRDSTRDMVSRLGRSSRLGERSRGVIDAGAASCCLILQTMAATIKDLLH